MSDTSEARASKRGEGSGGGRLEKIVQQQEAAIMSFAKFVENTADMTLRGNFSPSEVMKEYANLWKDWAKQFAAITREVLRD